MRRYACLPCIGGEHGEECLANTCVCRCRAMLGLDGPFDGHDWSAPHWADALERDA